MSRQTSKFLNLRAHVHQPNTEAKGPWIEHVGKHESRGPIFGVRRIQSNLLFGSKDPEIERRSRVYGARLKVLTRSRIVAQRAFSCKCVSEGVSTNPIEKPPVVGDSTWDNTAGSGRKKPKRTSRYPYETLCVSSEMLIVLVTAETRKKNADPDQLILQSLVRGDFPATGPSHSCGRAVIAVAERAGR
jgi:hypothetical protein